MIVLDNEFDKDQILKILQVNKINIFYGAMGMGKTTFVAKIFSCRPIQSPTYCLYYISNNLLHADIYRVEAKNIRRFIEEIKIIEVDIVIIECSSRSKLDEIARTTKYTLWEKEYGTTKIVIH